MATPDEVWFVQLKNVGTFLGPMPLDALIEMARTGVLLRRDLARRNESEHWRSASDLTELMGEFSAGVPAEDDGEPVSSTEANSPTLAASIATMESAVTAAADVVDDPLAFAFSGPSSDVIVFPTEPPISGEPVSTPPSEPHFEMFSEPPIAVRSESVPHTTSRTTDVPPTSVPIQPARTDAKLSANEVTADELVRANLAARSAPAPVAPAAFPKYSGTKVRRGPSALARLRESISELPATLKKPINLRVVAAIGVLAVLVWYFLPSGPPARRPPPTTAEVVGVIRCNGNPVSNALVMFRPDRSQGTIGPPSVGQSDEAGQFKLTINNVHPGAVAGKHQVAVRSRDSAGGSPSSTSVPKRYAQFETSPLVTEVLPDQVNEITLDLKSN